MSSVFPFRALEVQPASEDFKLIVVNKMFFVLNLVQSISRSGRAMVKSLELSVEIEL